MADNVVYLLLIFGSGFMLLGKQYRADVKENQYLETTGLLLVRNKNKVVAELAFKDANKPIGVG
jgi:hypothetical protein